MTTMVWGERWSAPMMRLGVFPTGRPLTTTAAPSGLEVIHRTTGASAPSPSSAGDRKWISRPMTMSTAVTPNATMLSWRTCFTRLASRSAASAASCSRASSAVVRARGPCFSSGSSASGAMAVSTGVSRGAARVGSVR
ncbi:hypothetical protein, partial [Corallococcus sp. 4LFB]|uniref:hypothetical protein n=1 Tax=Corallococcus sp. 4LFB TaxID=3383249 RepID=UPI0039751134